MIEIVLAGCAVSLGVGLAVGKANNAALARKNAKLKKALLKQERDNTAARDGIMQSVGELQAQIFYKDEEINQLRIALHRKEQMLQQKWKGAKEERK